MRRTWIVTSCVVLLGSLLFWSTASAHRESRSLAGGWTFVVTPQPNPNVPNTPPAFQTLFAFEQAGTLTQTDTAFHPRSLVKLFPDLGPMSGSDGWGVWEPVAGNKFRARFTKYLFDENGQHVGFLITRLDITLRGSDRAEAISDSAFVLGTNPDAVPFFSGGISRVSGVRLAVDAD